MKQNKSEGGLGGRKLVRNQQKQPKESKQPPQQQDNEIKEIVKEKHKQGTSNLNLNSLPHNVNYYSHFLKVPYITETDIDWVLKLRTEDTNLKEKLNKIPNVAFSVFDKKISAGEKKHTSQDLTIQGDVKNVEHLMRKRVGQAPSLGQLEFETNLRSYTIKDKRLQELEKGFRTTAKKDRHDFPEFLPKVQEETKLKKTIKETEGSKNLKLTYTAFDGYQNYPQYSFKIKSSKNAQLARHLLDQQDSRMSHVQWSMGLR